MGFFDDLIVPDQPEPEPPEFHELGPYVPTGHGSAGPPTNHFLPATVAVAREVGAGPYTRVMLSGCSVWPNGITLHLSIFTRRISNRSDRSWHPGQERAGDLHAGLLLADGRRVTTLDGEVYGIERLRLRAMHGGSRGGFNSVHDLYLTGFPPEGPMELVVTWPDEDVPESRLELDGAELREAANRVVQIWPGLTPPSPRPGGSGMYITVASFGGGGGIMGAPGFAPPMSAPHHLPSHPPVDPDRYEPKAEWPNAMTDWEDLRLIQARLEGGADPDEDRGWQDPVLHQAAAYGSPEVLSELIPRVADLEQPDENGYSPLYSAVCWGKRSNAEILLAAGADPNRELAPGWTIARLALVTPLAPLFEGLPGVRPLTDAERAEQQEADALMRVFEDVETEGLGIAFVHGLDEDEVIRRLGADPADWPVRDLAREPGRFGTGPGGFDPSDHEESLRHLNLAAIPGGCVIFNVGYLPSTEDILQPLSPGTVACGMYFNPKGGTFACIFRDGHSEFNDEVGLNPGPDSPYDHWLYRFWSWADPYPRGRELAFLASSAGLRPANADPLMSPPNRWFRVSYEH